MLADRATLRYHRHPCAGFLLLGRVSSILQGILRVSITALSHLLSILYAGLNDGEELGCRTSLSCISKGVGDFCARLLSLRTGKLSSAFRLQGVADIFGHPAGDILDSNCG